MKEKILYLILGILIGAVITAFCFVVYSRTSGKSSMPSMPNGGSFDMQQITDENGNTINFDRGQKGDMHQNQNTVTDTSADSAAQNQTSNS